ncbi:hypothetical protein ALC56_07157 [Trachymyrmex septentrionalis]|uniref:Uncharacterized protein n=1 Tax=Trachymyrmex septentrionalis TaxID=34720 RepID=A0A151JWD5_9HYME|nr:hypothetical protein ALC56_07157 [Trachymyrmex septentrionalis]
MTETLERALAPLLIIGSFCNLCMIEYPRGQPRAYLSYLYALAKWCSLTYFCYYPIYVWHLQENQLSSNDFVRLGTIILILISLCRFKVQIFKCTPGSNIIILDLLVLLFFRLIVFLIKSIKNSQF